MVLYWFTCYMISTGLTISIVLAFMNCLCPKRLISLCKNEDSFSIQYLSKSKVCKFVFHIFVHELFFSGYPCVFECRVTCVLIISSQITSSIHSIYKQSISITAVSLSCKYCPLHKVLCCKILPKNVKNKILNMFNTCCFF